VKEKDDTKSEARESLKKEIGDRDGERESSTGP